MTAKPWHHALRPGEVASALREQWRALRRVLLSIYLPVVVALAIVAAVRVRTGIPIATFTTDPLIAVGGAPVYTGVISTLGGLVWCVAAAICLFSSFVIRTRDADGTTGRFLLAAGCVTSLLLVDDMFLFHEIVFPRYLGVPQPVVHATYICIVLSFLAVFRATILRTDFLLLAIALGAFGVSVALDLTATVNPLPGQFLLEDGAKVVGIASWAAYFVRVSTWAVVSGADLGRPYRERVAKPSRSPVPQPQRGGGVAPQR